jgi:hypothetical protein
MGVTLMFEFTLAPSFLTAIAIVYAPRVKRLIAFSK